MINTKKRNARFGKYPSCDMLNNALRFLMNESDKNKEAISEIMFAISKAGGYFHDDVAEKLKVLEDKE